MKLTKKTTYPAYPVHVITDVVLNDINGQVLYRSHSFDKKDQFNRKKKWRKTHISYGDAPLRGQQLLRPLYYHVNESKIPATIRMGIESKEK